MSGKRVTQSDRWLSCDGSAASAARHAHAQTDIDDSKLVQNHMIVRSNYKINVHMLTQHNPKIDTDPPEEVGHDHVRWQLLRTNCIS